MRACASSTPLLSDSLTLSLTLLSDSGSPYADPPTRLQKKNTSTNACLGPFMFSRLSGEVMRCDVWAARRATGVAGFTSDAQVQAAAFADTLGLSLGPLPRRRKPYRSLLLSITLSGYLLLSVEYPVPPWPKVRSP